MGKRLSKIITRGGDNGTTGLGDGSRVTKDDARIEAIGTVDELNSLLGLLLTHDIPEPSHSILTRIQHELFDFGGELSLPGHILIDADHTYRHPHGYLSVGGFRKWLGRNGRIDDALSQCVRRLGMGQLHDL